MARTRNALSWLWLSGLVLVVDLVSKYIAQQSLVPYQPRAVLPFFNLTLAFNRGAAFSFLSDAAGWQRWLFIAIGIVAVAVLCWWLARLPATEKWTAAGLGLILGGATGNLVERIRTGEVTDFIDLYYGTWHWPTFNVADSAISTGVALLLLETVIRSRDRSG